MKDPRTTYRGNLQHHLVDMIFLVVSAVISGAYDWESIEEFGESKLEWLRKFVPLKNGIPSHDTLGRVFSIIDYQVFNSCFVDWVREVSSLSQGEVVAIDGKRIRGSYDTSSNKSAIHIVSAFAAENNVCLGQLKCQEKSNEITTIPKLLELLAIKGCTVTIDAMGCQTKIAQHIIDKGADYILAVKDNQKELNQQVQKIFQIHKPQLEHTETDSGHGRVETRKCSVITNLEFLDNRDDWAGLRSVIKIESERYIKANNSVQKETRFYISSLYENAEAIGGKIRSHWSIENKLHWMLDVSFGEDASRKRKGNSPENFNVISKIALTLLEKNKVKGLSKSKMRLKAALDDDYREILFKF